METVSRPDPAGARPRRLGPVVRLRQQHGRCSGFPTEERYFRRNPHAPAPPADARPATAIRRPLASYPISRTLERFNDPG